jgi:hypothetical protein
MSQSIDNATPNGKGDPSPVSKPKTPATSKKEKDTKKPVGLMQKRVLVPSPNDENEDPNGHSQKNSCTTLETTDRKIIKAKRRFPATNADGVGGQSLDPDDESKEQRGKFTLAGKLEETKEVKQEEKKSKLKFDFFSNMQKAQKDENKENENKDEEAKVNKLE